MQNFRRLKPEPKEILDRHLADRHYMLGDDYTLVDMALWGWARV
jgi:glutathione S-transferase